LPQPNHYPTKTCEARPWTSAGGFAISASAKYEAAFRDNAIDEQVLRDLTAEDLKEIGVAAVGDRRKLLAGSRSWPPHRALGGASLAAQCGRAPKTPEASAERRPLTS
jgi:SAM domain (Sterile alpha motif)